MSGDDPIRQVLRPTTEGRVDALVPERPGAMRIFLVRRPDESGFRHVGDDEIVGPGDEVVAWLYDPARLAAVQVANFAYNEDLYAVQIAQRLGGVWPDELDVIARFVPASGARVLEVCCGTGRATPALLRDGNAVVGLDLSRRLVDIAASKALGPRYVCGDALALPFRDASFDVVLCLENSLGEFLEDPLPPFAEMARVCRPGGAIVAALRDVADPAIYCSQGGYVHLIRTFPPPRRVAFLHSALTRVPGVRGVEVVQGVERPWGGIVHHAVFRIGSTDAPG